MRKYILSTLGILPLLITAPVKAQCPVCTAAVIGGIGLARWLKIDDTISGLWIGGLIVATILWTINWCNRKKIIFWARDAAITIAYYVLVILPLYYYNLIGHPSNQIWGTDKILFGTIVGSIFFYAAYLQYENFKKKNGKALFPFQKVVVPVGTLAILSAIFWLITRP